MMTTKNSDERRNDVPVLTEEYALALEARLKEVSSVCGVDKYDSVDDAVFDSSADFLYAEFPDGRFWVFFAVE